MGDEMKTIREILQSGHYVLPNSMVAMLESREKERDEAEKERVKAAIFDAWNRRFPWSPASLCSHIYHSPEPEKLAAGYWWVRRNGPGHEWVCTSYSFEFVPSSGFEYRRWDDPPPEVTGRVEQQLPTAQEWIEKNVAGWDEFDLVWHKASEYPESPFLNVSDEIFDKLKPTYASGPSGAVYNSHDEALADLKRVLIEMGLAR